jgi:peptidoglycan/LPS O-acetylase OafA/YrhL
MSGAAAVSIAPGLADHHRRTVDLLLIIRGLAALSVVVWHVEGYKAYFPPAINTPGRVAVWLFFGISGYVISYGFVHDRYRLRPSDLMDFYTNRLLRIYPLFLSLSLLAWITEWLASGHNPIALAQVPAQLFAIQFNQGYVLNGVFWTLGIELHFYLLAPLLLMPLLANRRVWPVLAVVAYAAMVYWCDYAVTYRGWSWDGRNIVSNLPHFFVGMAACKLVAGLRPRRWQTATCTTAACGILAYTSWLYHRGAGSFWTVRGMLLVDAAILLFVLAHAGVRWRPAPAHPVYVAFSFLGVLSYGVYAWHTYLMKYIPWTEHHLFALMALTLVAASLTYNVIERPALRHKRHPLRGTDLHVKGQAVGAY